MKIKMYKKNHKKVNEEGEGCSGDMGGVSAPMATLSNTPGMGNAVPASSAGMTLGQQLSPDSTGSGDAFGTTKKNKKK